MSPGDVHRLVALAATEHDREAAAVGYIFVLNTGTEVVSQPRGVGLAERPWGIGVLDPTDPGESEPRALAVDLTSDNESRVRPTESLAQKRVAAVLDYLVASAHEERFEAGMESRFSGGLQQLYASDPSAVLYALRRRLDEDGTRPEVLSEVKRHWDDRAWFEQGDVEADTSRCLSTAENTLSVYALDQPERQVERVVAALALTRVIEECGIARISLPGTTPDPEANLWHQDPPFVRAGGVGRQTEDVTKECGIGIAGDALRLNGVTIRERGIRHS